MKSPAPNEPRDFGVKKPDFNVVKRRLPGESFQDLHDAIKDKKLSLGVDPLAAAEWTAERGAAYKKYFITALSILLLLAAVAAVLVALVTRNYWLLLALPIQATVFYLANANTAIRLWVTVAGVVSLLYFFNLLLNDQPTAATLVAYAGLTFAAVRASSSLTNAAFRKALIEDEALFVEAFINRACTVRDNKNKKVYEYPSK